MFIPIKFNRTFSNMLLNINEEDQFNIYFSVCVCNFNLLIHETFYKNQLSLNSFYFFLIFLFLTFFNIVDKCYSLFVCFLLSAACQGLTLLNILGLWCDTYMLVTITMACKLLKMKSNTFIVRSQRQSK